jgi:hypothetical protein
MKEMEESFSYRSITDIWKEIIKIRRWAI